MSSATGSDLPPIPRPLTRGSIPPDFKVFVEEGGYGTLKIKPGKPEILEEHPEKTQKQQRRSLRSRGSSGGGKRGIAHSADLPDIETDPDSDYDTDLEEELNVSKREKTKYAALPENEHLYTTYREQCKIFNVVPSSSLLKRGGLELTHIDLSNRSLGPKPIVALAKALASNAKVTNLDISGNGIGVAGSQSVFEMLRDNYFISALNVSNNEIIASVFDSFIESLQENSNTLLHLSMNNCKLNDACLAKVATIMLESRLNTLSLAENEFGFDAKIVDQFRNAIEENATLNQLDLSFSQFTPSNALLVLDGLLQNIFITDVNLAWNGLGGNERVAKKLQQVLESDEVIEKLDLSYNNFQDALGQLEALAAGLRANKSLKRLNLSGNSIHSHGSREGALKILKALPDNPDTGLTEISFDKVWVGLEFQKFLEENAEFFKDRISVVTGDVAAQPKKRAPPKVDPMTKLRSWLEANGMTLNSFFVKLDDDDSMTLSYDEFKAGVRQHGIPLTEDEITELIGMLDLDGDGDINYAELRNE